MVDLEIGDHVSVINKFAGTEYVGVIIGFSKNPYDTLIHIDTKQGRFLHSKKWEFSEKTIHMTFIFNETFSSVSRIDNILLACE